MSSDVKTDQTASRRLEMIMSRRPSRMHGWDFDIETLRKAVAGEVMPNPSIDLGNPCNLNCPYCFVEEKSSPRKVRRPDELSIEETYAVIEDFHRAGARTVNIVGAGEPTIDPHFEGVIGQIASLGMTPVVFTNGIRIAREPQLARFLYCQDASVVLKIDSRDRRLQDLVAGLPGYSQLRDQALQLLIEAGFAAHSPTRLGADTIAFHGNLHELPSIYRWCLEQSIHPIISEYIPTGRTEGGRFAGYASLPPQLDERRTIEEALQPLDASNRHWLALELVRVNSDLGRDADGPCAYYGGGACTQVLGVYVDISGNIWPCVARATMQNNVLVISSLGRLRDGDFPSVVWRSHPYLELQRAQFDGGCPYKTPPYSALTVAQRRQEDHVGPDKERKGIAKQIPGAQ